MIHVSQPTSMRARLVSYHAGLKDPRTDGVHFQTPSASPSQCTVSVYKRPFQTKPPCSKTKECVPSSFRFKICQSRILVGYGVLNGKFFIMPLIETRTLRLSSTSPSHRCPYNATNFLRGPKTIPVASWKFVQLQAGL